MSDRLSALDHLLAFVDRPWKGVLLVVLLIVGGGGYLLYLERAQIAEAILRNKVKPYLDVGAFERAAPRVLRETGGDVAILSEIRLGDNIAISRAGIDRAGHAIDLVDGPHEAIGDTINPKLIVAFLRNQVMCIPLTLDLANAEVAAQSAAGISYGCIVQVPPIFGVSVGGFFVGWRERPDAATERRATVIMRDTAMSLAVW